MHGNRQQQSLEAREIIFKIKDLSKTLRFKQIFGEFNRLMNLVDTTSREECLALAILAIQGKK